MRPFDRRAAYAAAGSTETCWQGRSDSDVPLQDPSFGSESLLLR